MSYPPNNRRSDRMKVLNDLLNETDDIKEALTIWLHAARYEMILNKMRRLDKKLTKHVTALNDQIVVHDFRKEMTDL